MDTLENQLTIYLDLMGFSEANSQLNDNVRLDVLRLLKAIASQSSEFRDKSTRGSKKGYARVGFINMRPTTSAYSDHVLMSYPIARIKLGDHEVQTIQQAIIDAATRVASFAAAALRCGFLVRGGMTCGLLYHSRGVVMGPALIEAYKLESSTAVYPRIVISSSLARRIGSPANLCPLVDYDYDGIAFLDYQWVLVSMVKSGWYAEILPIVRKNIMNFAREEKLSAYSKWVWFAESLSNAVRRLSDENRVSRGIPADVLSQLDWRALVADSQPWPSSSGD